MGDTTAQPRGSCSHEGAGRTARRNGADAVRPALAAVQRGESSHLDFWIFVTVI
jgi:hypothetical protein